MKHVCPLCKSETDFLEEMELEFKAKGWPYLHYHTSDLSVVRFVVYSPEVSMILTKTEVGFKDIEISFGYGDSPPEDKLGLPGSINFALALSRIILRYIPRNEIYTPTQAKTILDAVLINMPEAGTPWIDREFLTAKFGYENQLEQ